MPENLQRKNLTVAQQCNRKKSGLRGQNIKNSYSEEDWKLFRKNIPEWQESYMDKLNKEYIKILNGEGDPSDKFWKLEKRIKEDKKDCGVQCEMSRSNQFYIMVSLLNEGAITMEDLEEFSDDLKDTMKHFARRK